MQNLSQNEKEISIKISTEGLTSTQIRLIKILHSLMGNVVVSEEESEYFDASADLFKKAAELIKHSHFATKNKKMSYGDQAIEFAVDGLTDLVDEKRINNIDN